MDKIISVLVIILVIAVIVIGEIYFRMDRNRTLAVALLRQMDFTRWLDTAEKMFSACPKKWTDAYSPLKSELDSIKPRCISKKVAVLNSIRSLGKEAIAENLDNAEAVAFARQLTDDFMAFADLQLDYNGYAYKVNHALEGGVSRTVGALFHAHRLDKLSDLTVL